MTSRSSSVQFSVDSLQSRMRMRKNRSSKLCGGFPGRDLRARVIDADAGFLEHFPTGGLFETFAGIDTSSRRCPDGPAGKRTLLVFEAKEEEAKFVVQDE
jgi:hypothetical protein